MLSGQAWARPGMAVRSLRLGLATVLLPRPAMSGAGRIPAGRIGPRRGTARGRALLVLAGTDPEEQDAAEMTTRIHAGQPMTWPGSFACAQLIGHRNLVAVIGQS